jgi:hypothetical protein
MNYTKLNVNISAATFTGLSLSYQRKIAFFTTLSIWLGVSVAGFTAAHQYGDSQAVTDIAIISLFGMVIHYIFGGELFLYTLARVLFKLTPLGVLYRHDKAILDRGKVELLEIACSNDLYTYLHYAKINPEIRSAENLQVIVHQKKGDMQEWTKNVKNLKKLANLVYQIHLVERFLAEENGING